MTRLLLSAALLTTLLATPAVFAQDAEPPAATAKERIAALTKKLGADDYDTREAATLALIEEGRAVIPHVRKVYEETTDPEVKNRCAFILQKLDSLPAPDKGPVERSSEGGSREVPPGLAPTPGLPDMDEMFRDMGLPKEFQKLFEGLQKELQRELQRSFEGPGADKGREETQPGKPRVRVWTFPQTDPKGEEESRPRAQGFSRHPTGLVARPLSPALRTHLKLRLGEGGVIVSEVYKGSWGERAGLELHDIILSVEGKPVTSLDDLDVLLEKEAKAEVIRRGDRSTLSLPKRPPLGEAAKEPRDF